MTTPPRPGQRWRDTLDRQGHVEVVTAYDCVTARLVQEVGFDGIVVGGGATANFSYGLPDIGLVTLPEILENVRRIAAAVRIPVIADVDDGGATAIHIRRAVELAERSGAAGIMIEDVDSARPKHLWNDATGDWELSETVLYPVDTAAQRLRVAIDAREDPSFVIMARTDAVHTDPERGLTIALERAKEYAGAGADSLFVLGLPRHELSEDLVDSLGAPLLYAEVGAVSAEERSRVFATGASLFHGLLPLVAAFSAFKETLVSVKAGTPAAFDRDPWTVNRELLETLDLRGWTRYLRAT